MEKVEVASSVAGVGLRELSEAIGGVTRLPEHSYTSTVEIGKELGKGPRLPQRLAST